ncbi:uncharacterized protein EHS24_000675 [Apiotrichum porosum]|uniref:Enoyl CoA hydratase n=1 Tax=Apiotrichum porosum TaxID=105984 RepID=A0A427YAP1_9TREE|nr:uncharacterized protein EHS24_000675 [Apiotrichum porosum]RSH88148.1 hypothetical protein EHS24_000675 [Apiotrichum porosum]
MTDVSQYNGKFHRASSPSPNVLLLEFNRKPANAFHDPFWMEMRDIIERVSRDGNIRCIVLSSALDKFFTAGLDLDGTSIGKAVNLDAARRGFELYNHIKDFQDAISSLEHCRQPVICAMYGYALGLAIDIASACDVRFAASNVTMGIMEVKVGLAADIGTLQRLPKVVGNGSLARELALTGRKFGAATAQELGFVSKVVDGGRQEVIDAALVLAKEIAENSPVAVYGTKHIMNHARDHAVQEGLNYEAAWNASALQSNDTAASILGVRKRQVPVYENLPSAHVPAKL